MLYLKSGLKYPWGAPRRLWNILWALIPIIGWFALGGYGKRIVNSIVKKNTKALPEFGAFWDNFVIGFMLFLKMLPIMIIIMTYNFLLTYLKGIAVIYWPLWLIYIAFSIFIMPWIGINLMQKYTVASTFEFGKAANIVFGNFAEYIIVLVKTIGYVLIYAILSIVLIGIPCLAFGQRLFIADFYASVKA